VVFEYFRISDSVTVLKCSFKHSEMVPRVGSLRPEILIGHAVHQKLRFSMYYDVFGLLLDAHHLEALRGL
jgi:hypothetical protein